MPEIVESDFGHSLGWDINRPYDPNWINREYNVIKGLCKKAGRSDTVGIYDYRDFGTFEQMLIDLDGTQATVLIPDEVVLSNANITVPSGLTLVRCNAGRFVIPGGRYLLFSPGSRLITEDNIQVFDVTAGSCGVGGIMANAALPYFTLEMFGGGGQNGIYPYINGIQDRYSRMVNLHIIKDLAVPLSYTLDDTVNIECIRPGVKINVAQGETLAIYTMSAQFEHDPFEDSDGSVVLYNAASGGGNYHRFRLCEPNDVLWNSTAGYVQMYFDSNGVPKYRDANGDTHTITSTPD